MNAPELISRLETDNARLIEATENTYFTHTKLAEARTILANAEARETLAGLTGKNAEERKSELSVRTQRERQELEATEHEHRRAQLAHTIAELNYRTTREIAALNRSGNHQEATH